MPDLEPVGGNPFAPTMTPVSGDPFADSIQGDVGAAGKALQTQEAARRATVGGLLQHFTLPGRIAAGVKPETPEMMSEADAYRLNQLQNEAENWAPQQAANMIGSGVPRAEAGALGSSGGGIKAYHGSPHDFEKFDVSKIGTGEGAQAYGHGLYFAEHPNTAETYKGVQGAASFDPMANVAQKVIVAGRDATERLKQIFPKATDSEIESAIARAKAPAQGRMYEVNINADPEHFLDWDKPLSEQHPVVQKAFNYRNHNITDEEIAARRAKGDNATADFLETQRTHYDSRAGMKPTEEFNLNDPTVVEKLREAGIPGIKYLDQGSRSGGEGTHNYVVFHHGIVDILKKYGLAGLVAGGAAHFSTTPHTGDPFSQ